MPLLLFLAPPTAIHFDEIEFIHVPQELNKRADAIATAASWSKEDATCAVNNHHWDPRSQHITETSEEWIILNSTLHCIQFFKNHALFLSPYFGQHLRSCVFLCFSHASLHFCHHFFGLCLKSFQGLFFDFDSFLMFFEIMYF